MSGNDMPELGSKISLISNADIRYEGKLYAVDPQECTIALATVKSFGTEDRKAANPVPAQQQTYDYILFRATDIKDISVIPAPQQLLYDPAIVQLSAPPNLGSRYGTSNTRTGQSGGPDHTTFTHPVVGNMGHQSFLSAPGTGAATNTLGFNPMHSGLHNLARPSPSEFLHHHNDDLLANSRSSTPALRKPSPTVDQSTQANSQQQRRQLNNSPQHQQKDRNQTVFYRSGKDNRSQGGNMRNNQRNGHQQHHQQGQGQQQLQQQHQQRQRTFNQQGGGLQQRGGGGITGVGGGFPPGGIGGNLGGGHLGGRQRSNRPPNQRGGGGGGNFSRAPGGSGLRKSSTTPLKFEVDYDFDKANTEFEELFAKMKIDHGDAANATAAASIVNGQDSSKLKDDSGNETGPVNEGEATTTTTEAAGPNADEIVFYNKTKSFFDNISCEAVERSKGRSQKTDWRKERKLNSETFGVTTARRNMFGRTGPRGGGGYFYASRGGYFGTRSMGYRPATGGGIFKQQNKPPYRSQQQPQIAKA